MASAAVASNKSMVREEPEKIKKWREDQKQRLEEKGKKMYFKLYQAHKGCINEQIKYGNMNNNNYMTLYRPHPLYDIFKNIIQWMKSV